LDSIRRLYLIGLGPSSSHTMGPRQAALTFREIHPQATAFRITLYGSLAATGKGHLTDRALTETLRPVPVEIVWNEAQTLPYHPNALKLQALDAKGGLIGERTVYSIGGGTVVEAGGKTSQRTVYPLTAMQPILALLDRSGRSFWEFVYEHEGADIERDLARVWAVMKAAIRRGLENEGILPGGLQLARKAASIYIQSKNSAGPVRNSHRLFAYALAVAEENAAGGEIVTAPTCGSAGVLPSVLYHLALTYRIKEKRLIKALATAGLFGNLVKTNGSVSGAEVGCQGEIGTACSMAAAAAQLLGGTPAQIEYAAEMGMEHHLGLTCDPVAGLVQIPCIERNAMAAARAVDCAAYALLSDGRHRISFDQVVDTMTQTGHDLMSSYRETSRGGLARFYSAPPG
jgi:L-serine dehydratase